MLDTRRISVKTRQFCSFLPYGCRSNLSTASSHKENLARTDRTAPFSRKLTQTQLNEKCFQFLSFGRSFISDSNYSKSPNKLWQVLDSRKNRCNFSLGKLTKEHKIFTLSRKPTLVSFKGCCCENLSQLKLPMPEKLRAATLSGIVLNSHCSQSALFNK